MRRKVGAKNPLPDQQDLARIFTDVEFSDAYRISYLANAIVVPTYEDIKRDFGIIRAEYHLLLCLYHYPILTAQDISRMTRRPRNSISRAVHRMLEEGLIVRAPDPEDGRQLRLSITPRGRTLHEKVAVYLTKREAELLDILPSDEREALRRTLQKLAMHAASLNR